MLLKFLPELLPNSVKHLSKWVQYAILINCLATVMSLLENDNFIIILSYQPFHAMNMNTDWNYIHSKICLKKRVQRRSMRRSLFMHETSCKSALNVNEGSVYCSLFRPRCERRSLDAGCQCHATLENTSIAWKWG